MTDYAGLHVTDPNWYEEGNYVSCLLEPTLLNYLNDFLRSSGYLKGDQGSIPTLKPNCWFTERPNYRTDWFHLPSDYRRPDLMLLVEGGIFEDWGEFRSVYLVEESYPFKLDGDYELIKKIREKATLIGKQPMTDDEYDQHSKELQLRVAEWERRSDEKYGSKSESNQES